MIGDDRIEGPKKLSVEKLNSSNLWLIILSLIFLLIGIYLTCTSLLLQDPATSAIGLIIGLCILAFAAIFFIAPILTPNMITPTKLIVRFGPLFKIIISLSNIKKIEQMRSIGFLSSFGPIGTKYSIMDKRYTVLRSRQGVIKITLRDEILTGIIFKKELSEIVIDVSRPDMLFKKIQGDNS